MSLTERVALVTGASRGIGSAIARELGRQGAQVIGTATQQQGLDNISDLIRDNGIQGSAIQLDVNDAGSLDRLSATLATAGLVPDVLVNNAGITRDGLLMRMKDEDWEAIIATDLSAVFRLSKLLLRGMLKLRRGRIINIASVVGQTGNPGQSNYAAAKAGIIGFSKSLAREVGQRGITVNSVAPGFIDTDMTRGLSDEQREQLLATIPLGRLGEAREVAFRCGVPCVGCCRVYNRRNHQRERRHVHGLAVSSK